MRLAPIECLQLQGQKRTLSESVNAIQIRGGQGCDETRDLVSGIPSRTREVHIADILVLTQETVCSSQDVRVLTIQDKVLECLLNSQGKERISLETRKTVEVKVVVQRVSGIWYTIDEPGSSHC